MTMPSFVSLQMLNTCNLHCIQCDYHRESAHPRQLTTEDQCRIVRQIAEWSPEIRLKLTGGEPFLDKERLFAVLEEAHRLGLVTFILTNGTLIREEDIARLLDYDLGCISVSLDSHLPSVHDAMRGTSGCFERVAGFLRTFIQLRQKQGARTQLWASTILTRNSLRNVDALVAGFERLGFDSIKFQPLFPNYRREYDPVWRDKSPIYPTNDEVTKGIDRLLTLKKTHPILSQSEDHIEKIRRYFLSDGPDPKIVCGIMDRVMIIGCEGSVRFCFQQDPSMRCCEVQVEPPLDITMGSLQQIWEDSTSLRQKMKQGCHMACGLLWDQIRDILR